MTSTTSRGGVALALWTLVILTLFAAAAGRWLIRPWTVSGPSMQPTLSDGQRIAVDLWTYRWREPRIGELVLVALPRPSGDGEVWLVKRCAPFPEGTAGVGPSSLWLLGDNPGDSIDSRRLGPVPVSRVRGRVLVGAP